MTNENNVCSKISSKLFAVLRLDGIMVCPSYTTMSTQLSQIAELRRFFQRHKSGQKSVVYLGF